MDGTKRKSSARLPWRETDLSRAVNEMVTYDKVVCTSSAACTGFYFKVWILMLRLAGQLIWKCIMKTDCSSLFLHAPVDFVMEFLSRPKFCL